MILDKFLIRGPIRLNGEVKISGAKNSALPILFSALLAEEKVEIHNVPKLIDIKVAIKLMLILGAKIKIRKSIIIDSSNVNICSLPKNLVKSIRASICILGVLLTRFGKAKISLPGGCKIGNRALDLHINGLKKLGATINLKNNFLIASVKNGRLNSAHIIMNKVSVGATLNIMIAATLASGTTIIENAAKEPEIIDTSNFLMTIGAKIYGAGTSRIVIDGVKRLKGGIYSILPDRIETGTFLVAAAVSKGYIVCNNTQPRILNSVILKLREAGAKINIGKTWISLNMNNQRPKPVNLYTAPYPGFPTDMQAQFSLLNIVSNGIGIIKETIFENRFMHIPQLIRMGAKVKINKDTITCYGVKKLFGAQVIATDLRASTCLVLAGCIAYGITTIKKINYIDRGYDNIDKKLKKIGAKIKRISEKN